VNAEGSDRLNIFRCSSWTVLAQPADDLDLFKLNSSNGKTLSRFISFPSGTLEEQLGASAALAAWWASMFLAIEPIRSAARTVGSSKFSIIDSFELFSGGYSQRPSAGLMDPSFGED